MKSSPCGHEESKKNNQLCNQNFNSQFTLILEKGTKTINIKSERKGKREGVFTENCLFLLTLIKYYSDQSKHSPLVALFDYSD